MSDQDDFLLQAIDAGALDESADAEIAETFAAHQKLESLFDLIRQPAFTATELDQDAQVGRYEIQRLLGKGAFGAVYLARDPELDRLVAIKVLPRNQFATETLADKFLEEARMTAQLKHQGIVTVHDVGRDGDRGYIVLEYMPGPTLSDLCQTEQLSARRTAEIVASIADALHYAHKQGFLHRDLKPGNILMDEQGNPHVADFGLAVSEDSQQALAGQVVGTPAYMSPEQVRGDVHRMDGRTDIWSLGVVLYQLLTARQPFWTGTAVESLDNIQNKPPKPPRQIDTISAELEAVCLKCLEKDVGDRFTTAADLATALRRGLSGSLRRVGRGRSLWALVCLVGIVAVLVLALVRPWEKDSSLASPDEIVVSGVSDEVESLLRLAYTEKLDGSTPTATIKVEIDRTPDTESDWQLLSNGAEVSSEDSYRVLIKPEEAAHVYVVQIDSSGKLDWVFPQNSMSSHSSGGNPVDADKWVQVPEGTKAFYLDETLGVEHLYVIVTHGRWVALEEALAKALKSTASSQAITKRFGLRSRGIGGSRDTVSGEEQPVQGVEGAMVEELWFNHVAKPESRQK